MDFVDGGMACRAEWNVMDCGQRDGVDIELILGGGVSWTNNKEFSDHMETNL